jgi:hypothetical protein
MYNDGMAIYYSIQNFHDCIDFRHAFDVKIFPTVRGPSMSETKDVKQLPGVRFYASS